MNDQVEIHHPDRDKTLKVPARLWPGRLEAKGWQLANASTPAVSAAEVTTAWNKAVAPTEPVDRKEELRALLDAKGVEWDGRWGEKRLEAEYAKVADA